MKGGIRESVPHFPALEGLPKENLVNLMKLLNLWAHVRCKGRRTPSFPSSPSQTGTMLREAPDVAHGIKR